ncbi:hypothetical protein HK099_004510 [Clydaea vesicula]|uniref:Uncharacterized protein n=1 Tax=Clydaea vesicula TaxID=447962 RepID=A0AAD5XYK4_9FUNG|nr:hypothetical protein HK099_004510 [Clydaea vesicula]KAJ3392892.1 hypothetical protein HDU92_008114 [Lobulomyces angularis]
MSRSISPSRGRNASKNRARSPSVGVEDGKYERDFDRDYIYEKDSETKLLQPKLMKQPPLYNQKSNLGPQGLSGYSTLFKRKTFLLLKSPIFLLLLLGTVLLSIVSIAISSNKNLPTQNLNQNSLDNTIKNQKSTQNSKAEEELLTSNITHKIVEANKIIDGRPRLDFQIPSSLFAGASENLKWVNNDLDGSYVVKTYENAILLKHIEKETETRLVPPNAVIDDQGTSLHITDYSISFDLLYVLVATDYEKGWRHSFFANYYIFDVELKTNNALTTSKSDKSIPGALGNGKISLAIWAPKANHIAWIRDNDLYVTSILPGVGEPFTLKETRITNDGSKQVINGIADWVYEEEVLGSHDAMWFSPDGSRIAYLKFNETEVPEYHFQLYESPHGSYPREVSVKYPKPGFPNPVVTLHVATPSTTNDISDIAVQFKNEENFSDSNRLIVEVKWLTDSDTLLVRIMNRVQDVQRIFLVTPVLKNSKEIWEAVLIRDEPSVDGAWFNLLQPAVVVEPFADRSEPSYLELQEDANGFTHIAYYADVTRAEPTAWLTKGNWEVTEISAVDFQKGILYYLSTEVDSTQRHLYQVHLNGFDNKKLTPPSGLTYEKTISVLNMDSFKTSKTKRDKGAEFDLKEKIDISDSDATGIELELYKNKKKLKLVGEEGVYEALFSPKKKYYILMYHGPDVPWSRIIKTDDDWFKDSITNQHTRNAIPTYSIPQRNIFTIENEFKQTMNAKIIVPADFDPSGNIKYPVLMKVYGGPGSQTVNQVFGFGFMDSVANAGFVVLMVDGRGTGFKGRKFRTCVSKHLGKYEVDDQIAAAKWLSKLDFIDSERIALWGWSYGGYMASKVLEANSGFFALTMAVAPVTDWKYYDSIYTERYMKTPELNEKGYQNSAVTDMTGFENGEFLLIHGTSDDNVHFQNSADLIWRLTKAGARNYRVQFFTDSDHNIDAGGANKEVYALLKNFLFDKFNVMEKID